MKLVQMSLCLHSMQISDEYTDVLSGLRQLVGMFTHVSTCKLLIYNCVTFSLAVLDIHWISTYVFSVVFVAADGSQETPPDVVIISLAVSSFRGSTWLSPCHVLDFQKSYFFSLRMSQLLLSLRHYPNKY